MRVHRIGARRLVRASTLPRGPGLINCSAASAFRGLRDRVAEQERMMKERSIALRLTRCALMSVAFAWLFQAVRAEDAPAAARPEMRPPAAANVNVSLSTLFDAEPSIAVNPRNESNVIVAWMHNPSRFRVQPQIHLRASWD